MEIKFRKYEEEVSIKEFEKIEEEVGIKYPEVFKNFIIKNIPEGLPGPRTEEGKKWFDDYGVNMKTICYNQDTFTDFRKFLNFNETERIIKLYYGFTYFPDKEEYKDEGETYQYPKEILPFGSTSGGDIYCFDYRSPDKENPAVILCRSGFGHEDFGRIFYVADNFEEFLSMLGRPDREAKGPESITGEEWYQ